MSDPNNVARSAANQGSRIMYKSSLMGQLTIGVLLSTASLADEADFSRTGSEQLLAVTRSVESLLAESGYVSRWQLKRPIESMSYSGDWQHPIADVDFQDNSALGRVSKLRNLSLLTLAETGRTRLFLGVNDDGLVGLHFIAFPKYGDERYLSLVRMPYLKKDKPDSRFE
jgi:hypothetical protein